MPFQGSIRRSLLERWYFTQDSGANEGLYGQKVSAKEIVLKKKVSVPKNGRPLVNLLKEVSPKNFSK